ncbi:DUF4760 domain-containing protein [Streptomyces sp. NPDC054794]
MRRTSFPGRNQFRPVGHFDVHVGDDFEHHVTDRLDGFRESRSPDFRASVEYVLYHLRDDFPTAVSYLELPDGPKEHVRQVAFFYDELGKLVVHGVVDQDLVIGSYGRTIYQTWLAIAPYVYRERELRQRVVLPYLEHMAAVTSEVTASDIHRKMKLRLLPPTPSNE